MTTSDHYFTEVYTRTGVRLLLACGGNSCGIDLLVEQPPRTTESAVEQPNAAHLEVILQPRDVRRLPVGSARLLYEAKVPLRARPGNRTFSGHVELPYRLRPDLLRECHFRVTPATMGVDVEDEAANSR